MTTAKVLVWVRCPTDDRFCASSVASFTVPQVEALPLARSIATSGSHGGYTTDRPLGEGEYVASGFISTVLYASGRKRVVRPYE